MDFFYDFLFMIVIFISNTIQTITGFAGTVLAMPLSIKLVGIDDARVILNLIALISCCIIALKNFKRINKKELLKIIVFMLIGMFIGIKLLEIFPINYLLKVYGIIIILIAIKNLVIQNKSNMSKGIGIIVIIIAGIIHGMFMSGGALLVVYAAKVLRDKDEFRSTMSLIWVILNSILLFTQVQENIVSLREIVITIIALIPLFIAILVGKKLYEKLDGRLFEKIVYGLLIISGLLIIF